MEYPERLGEHRENLKDFLEEAELQQYYKSFRDILKVSKLSQLKFVITEDLTQIGLSKPEQRRYKKIYSKYFRNPYIKKLKKFLSSNKKNPPLSLEPDPVQIEQPFAENTVKVPIKHIISIEDIAMHKVVGTGQFGVVQQGTWTTGNQRLQVAIKCLGHERMVSNSTEFLKEAAVMHSIEHPNIVRLYGVVLHLDSLMLVTELAPLRSLLECLREISLRPNFPVPNLAEFAEQICDGMAYLESKRLIHRDLAARNILVFNKNKVKISDFGLSRALGVGKDYYQTNYNVNLKLPVAWCAPECILYLRFTTSSDMWAFGVCLWEMFTYGFQPWAAFSGQQILEAIDAPNYQRLERPDCCPEAYYSVMLECWSHDPNDRPKFKDLGAKLCTIRPEQVQASTYFQKPEDGRRHNFLEYKTGDIITVLGKEKMTAKMAHATAMALIAVSKQNQKLVGSLEDDYVSMTRSALWYGVLPGGACGIFDPNQTKPYVKLEKLSMPGSMSPHPTRSSSRSIRSSLLRADVKRHTYTGKRAIQRSMISSPQGDVKHTGHVGLDGAYFGDISFLDPAGCPPRQVVTPYKPSEDLEQVPLINPNSPSHLTGASGPPAYPLLSHCHIECAEGDEVDLPCVIRSKGMIKCGYKTVSEPTTSKGILSKMKNATLGRGQKGGDSASKTDEVHEYHEISDTDTESYAADANVERPTQLETPGVVVKPEIEFSQSLLAELESMFRSLDGRRRDEPGATGKQFELDVTLRSNSFTKTEKKKIVPVDTMKPMSAHDEKTLKTAVALANEFASKSMTDLDGDQKPATSPSDRTKASKTPLASSSQNGTNEAEKDTAGKLAHRNFSEVAKSVPDIQSTITKESKMAYSSLIEEPTPSTSLISHIKEPGQLMPTSLLKSAMRTRPRVHFHSLPKPVSTKPSLPLTGDPDKEFEEVALNELPLPPRGSNTALIEMPRHIRRHPLKHPMLKPEVPPRPILYQNTTCPVTLRPITREPFVKTGVIAPDVVDAAIAILNEPGPSGMQPLNNHLAHIDVVVETENGTEPCSDDDDDDRSNKAAKKSSLVKGRTDHVSVEDLLAFADQKPCGRQRGIESDEVRVMDKVLQGEVSPEECLEALELSDWNVHFAIKIVRVKISVPADVSYRVCCVELITAGGDILKAVSKIEMRKRAMSRVEVYDHNQHRK